MDGSEQGSHSIIDSATQFGPAKVTFRFRFRFRVRVRVRARVRVMVKVRA